MSGETLSSAAARVTRSGWILIAQQEAVEIYPVFSIDTRTAWRLSILLAGVLFTGWLFAFLFTRSLARLTRAPTV